MSSQAFLPVSPLPTSSHKSPLLNPVRPSAPVAVADSPAPISLPSVTTAFNDVVMNTYTRYPLAFSHGQGALLHTIDNITYLDCVAGIATCTLGHAHPNVTAAITAQLSRLTHVSNLYYIPEQAALATWLVANSPTDKAFFCNSGGEANEAAIKLARKRWHILHNSDPANPPTPVILTARQSFHGRTLATLTATGQPKYHRDYWPLVDGFDYVTYNDVDDLQRAVDAAGDNLAGILLEALQGEGGIHPGTPEFFAAARKACDERDALLMCDEVQVGVGRTGKLWGFEHTGVNPDVFTLAKGLGGGVPIGAMLCTERCDVFRPGDHASTFGGNPLACSAGLAVAKELDGGVLDNARARGEQLGRRLAETAARFPAVVNEVRGLGLIRGVELKDIAAGDVVRAAMERGLLLVPAGLHVVRFVPPLVISEEQVEQVVERFEKALTDIQIAGK